jgi:N-succinyldiaminopimelate aminotransferase
MNPNLDLLQPYPFQRLQALFADLQPATTPTPIALSIGEPRHPMPAFVQPVLEQALSGFNRYPTTRGEPGLREAIARWLRLRFNLPKVDAERQVLPLNGTREGLFALAQAVVTPGPDAAVLMPNPFYQIYEGAALLAGAEPLFYNLEQANGYRPQLDDLPAALWDRVQLLYICNPGNPAGAVMSEKQLSDLIERAERHDFVIAADECYSEIYPPDKAPPPGLLGAAARLGNADFSRCVAFHSLSKRSNLPGLRSGFVAGDSNILDRFALYRTYHGCTLPGPVQAVSAAAWADEMHVHENRWQYAAKFAAVLPLLAPVLDVARPDAGFYLWPRVPGGDDEAFARRLKQEVNVTVLPGRYLSRPTSGGDPGAGHVRMALVAEPEACVEAAQRIRTLLERG